MESGRSISEATVLPAVGLDHRLGGQAPFKVEWQAGSKIVTVPEDAVLEGGYFKTAKGIVIGSAIRGEFAVTEAVYNDLSQEAPGKLYKSPASPRLGLY